FVTTINCTYLVRCLRYPRMDLNGYDDLSEFFYLPFENSDDNNSQVESKSGLMLTESPSSVDRSDEWKNQENTVEEDDDQNRSVFETSLCDGDADDEVDFDLEQQEMRISDVSFEKLFLHHNEDINDVAVQSHIEENGIENKRIFCRSRALRCRGVEESHPFSCTFCSKSFNKRWRLSCHLEQVHAKIRNFACSDCGKRFRSDYDLRRHSTTHTGERFVCYHCDSGFASKQRVACHIRRSLACWDRKS
ncbi:hypothetical protein PENTCL1PPCAC_18044, partial [Pristionchus entomophagus]